MKPAPYPTAPTGPRFNRAVIERFLCAHHGVKHPWEFIPFRNMLEAWEIVKPVTLTVETTARNVTFFPHQPAEPQTIHFAVAPDARPGTRFLDSPEPAASVRFLHPVTKQPIPLDFDHVYAYSIVTRHLRSSMPWPVALRLNFYHQGKETIEPRAEHDYMMAVAGAPRAGYATLTPTSELGLDVDIAGMPREPFAFRNEFFTATMALVNESNLQNGIVTIPPHICKEAGLPIFQGRITPLDGTEELLSSMMEMSISETEQKLQAIAKKKELKPISDWRAIPINHVLAWGMQSDEYARDRGLLVHKFFYSPPVPEGDSNAVPKGTAPPKKPDDILLYYLIDNTAYEQLLEFFRRAWLGKVDVRPLSSMAFEMQPIQAAHARQGPPQVRGDLMARSSISYFVAPKLTPAQLAHFAPALCPGFPSCHEWNPFKTPYLEDGDICENTEEEKK